MEFRNLYSFLRVAEIGNFTKAAEELGYAQSTVTTQIQQLEKELGVSLFERIGKKNMLTFQGQQLLVYANRILQNVEEMKQCGQIDAGNVTGTLRIGIMESLLSSVLLSVVGIYREKFPNISLQIRLGVTEELVDLLQHNEVDVVFAIGEQWNTKNCDCVATHQERAVFFASQDHPIAERVSLTLHDIFGQSLILTGEKTYIFQELRKIAFQGGYALSPCIQTDSAKVIIDMVAQNLGLSLLPEYLVRHAPFAKNYYLRVLNVEDFSMPFYTHILYHKNKWITPQMIGLVDLINSYWQDFDSRCKSESC